MEVPPELMRRIAQTCVPHFEPGTYCFPLNDPAEVEMDPGLPRTDIGTIRNSDFLEGCEDLLDDIEPGQQLVFSAVNILSDQLVKFYDISFNKVEIDNQLHLICCFQDRTDYYTRARELLQKRNQRKLNADNPVSSSTPVRYCLFEYQGNPRNLDQMGIEVQSMLGDWFSAFVDQATYDKLLNTPQLKILLHAKKPRHQEPIN